MDITQMYNTPLNNMGITDFDPANNPIHAYRLEYGDMDEYDFILSDESYQYFINKFPDKPDVASKNIGMAILAKFARDGFRQRVGQEEAYLGERYKNYLDWLKQRISNPSLLGRAPVVYVGGVFIEAVEYYDTNPEFVPSQFYRGLQTDTRTYLERRNSLGLPYRRTIS